MRTWILGPSLVVLALAACVQSPPPAAAPPTTMFQAQPANAASVSPPPAPPPSPPPSVSGELIQVKDQVAQVTFIDTDEFDDQLSDTLDGNFRQVDVVAPERYGLNSIPKRLEKWFSVVKDSGGKVRIQPLPPENEVAMRGFVMDAVDLVISIFHAVREQRLYAPGKQYDVLLLYRKDTGIVETARFTHRES